MCGIVGAVAQRDIAEILLEGLRRLEYRGYDSAGLAVVDAEGHMTRLRRLGKVQMLAARRTSVARWYRYCPYPLGDARRTV
jgi:glucosamine--fructose-6-phosphate aminotransferase (isomerizing)